MSVVIKNAKKSQDNRIHLEEPREAVYWSKKFEVSSVQLLKAVKETGTNKVEKIAEYLTAFIYKSANSFNKQENC